VAIIRLDKIYQRSYIDKIKHITDSVIGVGKGTKYFIHIQWACEQMVKNHA